MTQPHPGLPAGSILVTGRDRAVTDQVAGALLRDGHRVLFAVHGREARDHLEEERFDLIVVDSSLPPDQVQDLLDCARRQLPAPLLFLITSGERLHETVDLLRHTAGAAAEESHSEREEEFPGDTSPGYPFDAGRPPGPDAPRGEFPEIKPMTLDEVERAHILHVLRLCNGNKKKAAALLGIHRSSLYGKLKRFSIMMAEKVATMVGIVLLALAGASLLQAAPAARDKIAPAVLDRVARHMDGGEPDALVPLIVQTWTAADSDSLAALERVDGIRGRVFASIHGYAAEVAARKVARLARSPRVKRISLDWPMTPAMDTAFVSTGALHAVRDAGFTGEGVGVAVLDSGVSPVLDLPGVVEVDMVESDGVAADRFGHGTHVAGIVAGTGEASLCRSCYRTFSGIAPGARIFSVKVLDGHGAGRASDVIAGLEWVLRHHEARGIRVVNLSLGHPVDEPYATDPLCGAVEQAWRAGLVVVVSAGNQGAAGPATVTSPGNHPSVITVGAAEDWDSVETSDDIVAPFSSLGPTLLDGVLKPDILAPGTHIISLRSPGSLLDDALSFQQVRLSEYVSDPPHGDGPSPYIAMSGTSTAAPAVAGAAAILLSQDPEATPDDIKVRLMASARKLPDSIVARGAGLLDVGAAVELGAARVSAPRAPTPKLRVVYDRHGLEQASIEEIGSAWGDPEGWPSELVWGDEETWGVSTAWIDPGVWLEPEEPGAVPDPFLLDDGGLSIWGYR